LPFCRTGDFSEPVPVYFLARTVIQGFFLWRSVVTRKNPASRSADPDNPIHRDADLVMNISSVTGISSAFSLTTAIMSAAARFF